MRTGTYRRRLRGIVAAGLVFLQIAGIAPSALAQSAVDLSPMPMAGRNLATPNIVFGYDDSGSTDDEVLLNTNDGALWYSTASRNFWGATGALNTNATRSGHLEYDYLFPNGSASSSTTDKRRYGDSTASYAIPPIPAFAFLRSSAFNPIYYDPAVRYRPWSQAYIGGTTVTFADATPTAARWHPVFTGTTAIDLTANQSSTASDWTFRFQSGMTIPGASIAGITGRRNGSGSFTSITTDVTVAGTDYYDVNVPYYPATYWVVDSTCRSGTSCATAPDGTKLRRVEIRSSVTTYTKAAGRTDCGATSCTYAQELQNFANWFQYYRKRRFAMAAGVGSALSAVRGIRADVALFNGPSATRPDVAMYDFSAAAAASNGLAVIGKVYQADAYGGTPTRGTLKFIGQQFARTGPGAPIQYGCQRNNAFIVTDGYTTDVSETAPAYTAATWISAAPYTTTYSNSLADIAAALYTNNPRSDLTTGLLSFDPTQVTRNPDRNTNLHVNTFGITLGALGTIYGTGTPSANNPFINPPTWPNPSSVASPTSIDDLWHATINGRGGMYTAYNASDVSASLNAVVRSLLVAAGSDAGIAVSAYNIRAGNNTAYVSSFNAQDWTGQLAAYPIDITTGSVDTSPGRELWTARDQLDARTAASRKIASHDGSSGVKFASGSGGLTAALVNQLALTPSPNDGAQVLAWLRGDRTGEGTTYRARTHLLGDIVSAEPVYDDGILYQPANDGMLHAFDATTGEELWAYVPYNVLPILKNLASPTYSHRFFVDGTPTISPTDGTRKVLVAGLRGGGAGYYALDITDPRPNNETQLAGKVLWEFPNAATTAAVRNQIGTSYGKPVIAKTQTGRWVALVTSGYNNASGQNHLHVLDAVSGALVRTITTPSGSGLAQIAAWVADPSSDPTMDFVYGGDLSGNVWRFDLRGDPSTWSVVLLTSFGATQPVTATPELANVRNTRVVIVPTGRLLGDSDASTVALQSVYGLKDDMSGTPTIADPRDITVMKRQTVTVDPGGIRTITSRSVDWASLKGWYFDLPATGERVNTDPSLGFGTLVFTSNIPSPTACGSQSYLYAIKVETGGQLEPGSFTGSAWSGRQVGFTYASRPVLVALPNGKLVSITHKSDASVSSAQVPISTAGRLRKHGWRDIQR